MQFTAIRLIGFKSFIGPAELRIEPGLTGVVGPNGCGKSNILESMRWVMGANSAKAMRAGAMDEVIFSGSAGRPARNHAEVVLKIDNRTRTAPARFNDTDALEVSRRISRGAGSSYRINGVEVRARDVQLLFADASSGANSPALVRQGQIAELIAARPQNRRRVLEEAAGISGLHNRRHEAELRLGAAENNLARLDDVYGEIEAQHSQLKRQVRAATRYRNLSAQIRALQAYEAHLRWSEATAAVTSLEDQLRSLTGQVAQLQGLAAAALIEAEKTGEGLEELRREEAIAGVLVARAGAAVEAVEHEASEAQKRMQVLEERLEELARDQAREATLIADGKAALARLQEEESALQEAGIDENALAELCQRRDQCAAARGEAEEKLIALQAQKAADLASREAAERACAQAAEQLARTQDEVARAGEASKSGVEREAAQQRLQGSRQKLEAAQKALDQAREIQSEAQQARLDAENTERSARERFDEARREDAALSSEAEALGRVLQSGQSADWPAITEEIRVTPGHERALAAALGDDLQAALDARAPVHWQQGPNVDAPLPAGATALSAFVQGPPELAARLSQTGVVEAATGDALADRLGPGQRLVSLQGQLWRWDGLRASAEAPAPAAQRLEQRNRLAELEELCEAARQARQSAQQDWEQAGDAARQARQQEKDARRTVPDTEKALRQSQSSFAELDRIQSAETAREEARTEALARWQAALEEAQSHAATAESRLKALMAAEDDTMAGALAQAEATAMAARLEAADADGAARALEREAQSRASRAQAVAGELQRWRERLQSADANLQDLTERREAAIAEQDQAKAAPQAIAERRTALFATSEEAQKRRDRAADALAEAESQRRTAEGRAREAQASAAQARETRAGAEARLQGAQERLQEIVARIAETLHCKPQELAAEGETLKQVPVDAQAAAQKLEALRRQREAIGPVNLRAAEEAEEIAARLQAMSADQEDLRAAIAKLRRGIENLNAEGRTRLLAAFEEINEHFQSLFQTLFGGGQAELRLTESDDPLAAGLEVLASPPGKKLESMTLLSGGEQSLAALALIFAVFLSNPAPVCVLDEVEAALDDANVERFCAMLDEMCRRTKTRFIVITHNAVTMSRVERLYGVTMPERGVSQLVSVDLQRAEDLAATG